MNFQKIFKILLECMTIGFLTRYTLVFAYEAILGEWFLNRIGNYMLSGFLMCFVVWLVLDSELFKTIKEKQREYLNKKNQSDS